ncbi:MAG TPA: site-specific integrase [Terriglobales bacterium]|nr:site-specific integrase [Terriglobales bacterium]
MFTRTRYQYGSLETKERKKGKEIWEFRYYEPDAQGERQRRAVMVGTREEYPTESAARKAPVVQAILLRLNAEQPAAPGAANFGAVIARYEQEEMPERYSTRAAYQSYINNQIRPRWADTAMSAVKPMAVEDWLKNLALAPKTKSHVRSLMHTIFQCAERWELIEKNPIKLVRVKGGTKRLKTPRVLAPEEFHSLLPFIREPYRTMVLIAGCLGLRVSEIVALQWRDFDFPGRTLLIQRSVVHGRVGDVKTEYSRDSVPLDTAVVEALMLHKERAFSTPEGWLFANPVTKKPYHQEEIQKKHIRKAGTAAGIGDDIGWHTFRHSYRSWLDETGAPLTVQKELMRHASIQTTMNIYGKAMTDSKRQAHSKVVEMVLNSSKNDQTADHKQPVAAIGS